MKALVVIDMQNDFITGVFANQAAEAIVYKIKEFAEKFDGDLYFTYDKHNPYFYSTNREGRRLPIHCVPGTWGYELVTPLTNLNRVVDEENLFSKNTFASFDLAVELNKLEHSYDEILLCGTCTDICVISNAIMISNIANNIEVSVISDLCAGTTKENHENALKAMAQCQINIKTTNDLI
jgi:nicotinamidase-related amidase